MSIDGLMRTSISGMAAQSNKLGAVAENVANVATVGFKRVDAQFASLLTEQSTAAYASGGVETVMRHAIARQGTIEGSSSKFDLAINGDGFMVVSDADGRVALTRAGAFVPNSRGELVNAAGYRLMGAPASAGAGSGSVNSTAGLEPVVIRTGQLAAQATTAAALSANLPSAAAEIAAGDLPSANAAGSLASARTSMVVYGNLGEQVTLDLHFARSATPGEWEVAAYDAAGRSAAGGFPYASGPLATETLVFDANGRLDTAGATSLSLAVPGGGPVTIDLAQTTQLATGFTVLDVSTDGHAPGDAPTIEIAPDGTLAQVYPNGARTVAYRIPLANVASPDNLTIKSGNVFEPSERSGAMRLAEPGTGGLGRLASGALEGSTVDLASELTDMIAAQRSYTANSRVFQTGAELMDVIVNLKR